MQDIPFLVQGRCERLDFRHDDGRSHGPLHDRKLPRNCNRLEDILQAWARVEKSVNQLAPTNRVSRKRPPANRSHCDDCQRDVLHAYGRAISGQLYHRDNHSFVPVHGRLGHIVVHNDTLWRAHHSPREYCGHNPAVGGDSHCWMFHRVQSSLVKVLPPWLRGYCSRLTSIRNCRSKHRRRSIYPRPWRCQLLPSGSFGGDNATIKGWDAIFGVCSFSFFSTRPSPTRCSTRTLPVKAT